MSINSPKHDAASTIRLVRDIRAAVGVEIPDSIEDEIKIHRNLSMSKDQLQRELQSAVQKLYDVDASKFDEAKADVVDVSLRGFAAQEVDQLFVSASVHRLQLRVFAEIRSWEAAVVGKFNDCIQDFRLNELADQLPNFADPGTFRVVSMSAAQGEAVDAWRNASMHLQELWSLYRRLVSFRGDTIIGPAGVDDLSTNLLTACVLGDPGSLGNASSAATVFAGIAGGADSVGAYGPLLPFVVPPTVGYDLHLHTLDEAASVRKRLSAAA